MTLSNLTAGITEGITAGAVLTLHPLPPYDLTLTMNASRFYAVLGRQHQGAYRRALRAGSGIALVEIRQMGEAQHAALQTQVLATKGTVDANVFRVRLERLLNLNVDLQPFYEYAQNDPILWSTVQQIYGLRTFAAESLLEAVVLSIIEQQITLRMAHAAERWMLGYVGDCIEHEDQTYSVFPTAESLAALSADDLKPLKITSQRIQRILDIARGVADGTLDLEGLRTLPPNEIYARLRSLKGVGHWTAAWTMTRALGHFVNFGSADVALRAAVNAYHFGLPGNAAHEVVDTLLTGYAPHDGIAAFYTLTRWALEKYTYI
jgi:DNA-3-methyladenine glycosylase II